MTRAGGTMTRPDEVFNSSTGPGPDWVGGWSAEGVVGVAGAAGAAGGVVVESGGTGWEPSFEGKRGVVLALGGAPVKGGAEGRGGVCGGVWVSGGGAFAMLGIGLVTAVDQAGATPVPGTGSSWLEVCIGSVVAAETFGRGVGVILEEAGLRGRGGRLMRRVSRFGAFGSLPSGVAGSAISDRFYTYFIKCSMAKFAIVTYL
jgi:hypothetical protein